MHVDGQDDVHETRSKWQCVVTLEFIRGLPKLSSYLLDACILLSVQSNHQNVPYQNVLYKDQNHMG